MDSFKHVIIGGGMVAGYAATEFVERGLGRGELAIISSDDVLPYERPPLSKGLLLGTQDESSVFINDADFYREHGIDVRLGTTVDRIDAGARTVQMRNGGEVRFERAVVATGARVRTLDLPGSDLDGVLYLRSLDDSKRIRRAYEGVTRAIVLGSGFIGMEVASALAQRNVNTTMLFPDDRVWQRFFTPEMSAFFQRYYEERDVTFMPGMKTAGFEGDGRVSAAVTASGARLSCDLVVAGIGVVPNVELAKDAGLRVENGVVANEYLETSALGVYAAGDVASYKDMVSGRQRRVEHWDNAVEQGRHLARVMGGERAPFVHVPYFFSDVFDLSYEFWGDTADADDVVHRGDVTTRSFSAWWTRQGQVCAAFVMNRPGEEREVAPRWIAEHRAVSRDRLQDERRGLAEA